MSRVMFLLALFLVLFPQIVLANGAGLPAFFRINGELAKSNPLQLYGITASTFLIPQDFAPQDYLVNQPISFEVDETQLKPVLPQDALTKIKYSWDFGDGTTGTGIKNTHIYAKTGSYILILDIDIYVSASTTPTKFIDSFLLNILPDSTSANILPQAVIKINGTTIQDPLNNRFALNFNNEVSFDASDSKTSSPSVEYLWNFGDGTTATGIKVSHKYDPAQYFETVVLRVKDSSGFISDGFAGLKNNPDIQNSNLTVTKTGQQINTIGTKDLIILIIIGLLAITTIILLIRVFRKHHA